MAFPRQPRQGPGNPRGPYAPSRQRERLSSEYLGHLLAWMRNSGPKAIARIGKTQPAALLKIIALILPKEHKVEHSRLVSELSDQQLDGMIEILTARVEARAAGLEVPPLIDVTPEGDVLEHDVTKPRRGKRTNAIVANADSVVARPSYKRVKSRRTKAYKLV